MTISGRITASAALNILSRGRYLLPAFLALISHGGRNDHCSTAGCCSCLSRVICPFFLASITDLDVSVVHGNRFVSRGCSSCVRRESQVRALGVLIPGWGCYLFELVFEELTPVRVSARTNPFPACCLLPLLGAAPGAG